MKVITQVQAASISARSIRTRAEIASRIFSELKLQLAFKSKDSKSVLSLDPNGQSAVSNSGPKSISVDAVPNSNSNSRMLRLITLGTKYASPRIPFMYGEVEARYYLEPDKNDRSNLVVEFWPISNPQGGSNQNQATNPSVKQIIARNIKSLSFRFRASSAWTSDLGSAYGFTPNLVEVTISIFGDDSDTSVETFRTALPYGGPVR